jgi:hypothetical protein
MTTNDNVHQSLLEDVTTETLMKLLKFELWVDYEIRMNKSANPKEAINKELKQYKLHLGIKDNILVASYLDVVFTYVSLSTSTFRCLHFQKLY